ncbi:unnamed protein product [Gordionus sp. m RMFG-2023]
MKRDISPFAKKLLLLDIQWKKDPFQDSEDISNEEYPMLDSIGVQSLVRGANAIADEWPWIAYIQVESCTKTVKCGGTIIKSRYILTSAHCVKDSYTQTNGNNFLSNNSQPINVKVVTGINDIGESDRGHHSTVIKIIRHTGYKASMGEKSDDDLALLKLTDKLPMIVNENSRTNILQELELKYMSSQDCNKHSYAKSKGIKLSPNQFCSMQTSPIKGTNRGDSGGPYMCKKDNEWRLVGVIKMGDTGVSYFMDVRRYEKWIRKNT